jgi:hypothetical protein
MPKTSALPEDTTPTSDDYTVSLDNASGTLKKTKWSSLRGLFATRRANTTPSGASITPVCDTTDIFTVTALAVGASFLAPTGSPSDGQGLTIRIKDNGTAQSLAFNSVYRPIGITLPSTTVATKVIYIGCLYNAQDATWDVVSIGRQS